MATESQAIDAHATAIGRLVCSYTTLHEYLGHLFSAVMHGELSELSSAAWHAHQNDRAQREMLRHAATFSLRMHPQVLKKLEWLIAHADECANDRNTVLHGAFAVLCSEGKYTIIPVSEYGNRRSRQLENRGDITSEIQRITENCDALSKFSQELFPCIISPEDYPLPERPPWQHPQRTDQRN